MEILSSVAKELNLKLSQVENTVNLFDEGATVPFIARYRKEVTGNLDEEQIREVIEKVTYYRNLEKRKEGIILELKIVNSSQKLNENEIQKELEKECDIALKQIEEKKYSSVLKNAGIDNILKIGLAFFGKEVEVKFEKEK